MLRQTALLMAALVALASPLSSQQSDPDQMSRLIIHPTMKLDQHWFAASWLIGNVRRAGPPGNMNIFGGLGYRRGGSSLETMIWRQWGRKNNWLLDVRNSFSLGRTSFFTEVSPFLSQRALYHMSVVEAVVSGPLALGAETENTFRPAKNSIGYGPRVSWTLVKNANSRLILTTAYQYHPQERDLARMYLISHRKF
ncbi:hypothetical protein KW796_00460 [Candidatus Parcubacteria bacterium]|nr:hypothetical protein [Candidatus Parcubacteria bacterium]